MQQCVNVDPQMPISRQLYLPHYRLGLYLDFGINNWFLIAKIISIIYQTKHDLKS